LPSTIVTRQLWVLHKRGERYAASLRIAGDSIVLELRRNDDVVSRFQYQNESKALDDARQYRSALEIVGWSEET
jgi:hypothetical protein